jgi:HAD superfamily hydrolase (TIGR01509 family)
MESLEIILERYEGEPLSDERKLELCTYKNNIYREYLSTMTPDDVEEDVRNTLAELRRRGFRLALGSSSRNAKYILENVGLLDAFDAISDGNNITHSKPHPEVFVKAAEMLSVPCGDCLVVEDAVAGAQAGKAGGMKVACVGDAAAEKAGDYNLVSFRELLEVAL